MYLRAVNPRIMNWSLFIIYCMVFRKVCFWECTAWGAMQVVMSSSVSKSRCSGQIANHCIYLLVYVRTIHGCAHESWCCDQESRWIVFQVSSTDGAVHLMTGKSEHNVTLPMSEDANGCSDNLMGEWMV